MPAIHVCPRSRLADVLAASGARSVVSLASPGAATESQLIGTMRHLRLEVSDIAAPRAGHELAGPGHVRALLDFVAAWDRREALLMHCYAGVSRSTAAAFVALCHLRPDLDEPAVARRLRAASPTATPNPRLVALADDLLGRSGRMVEAIAGIGRGAECFEGNVFSLPCRSHWTPPAAPSKGAL